jgi:hypothetical protein
MNSLVGPGVADGIGLGVMVGVTVGVGVIVGVGVRVGVSVGVGVGVIVLVAVGVKVAVGVAVGVGGVSAPQPALKTAITSSRSRTDIRFSLFENYSGWLAYHEAWQSSTGKYLLRRASVFES